MVRGDGWAQLYGFPLDPRLWVAFFVHDLGYWGKPNMDGPEGEEHVLLGAAIMQFLFGRWEKRVDWSHVAGDIFNNGYMTSVGPWGQLCLFHSRYFAKKYGFPFSRLCVADKLAFALTPRWLYLPMVRATGELGEYLQRARHASDGSHWRPGLYEAETWHAALCDYMRAWVDAHRDGAKDTWTSADRHARDGSGVWQ